MIALLMWLLSVLNSASALVHTVPVATRSNSSAIKGIARQTSSVSVSSQADLKSNLVSRTTIVLSADIFLTSIITINGQKDLVIDGQGLYKVDGQMLSGCFSIGGSSTSVTLTGLTIANGKVKRFHTYIFKLF